MTKCRLVCSISSQCIQKVRRGPEGAFPRLTVTQMTILIDGSLNNARVGERLIDVIVRAGVELPHVCYHPQLGPIQTCDTCLVEIGGELVRACATPVSQDMSVRTTTARAQAARTEAFDRILTNHLLYCTVCDNNNGKHYLITVPRVCIRR